ncbi:hypothetical protein JVX93_19660 [Mycolicibacterium boenickei]|nr:hypothetical protein JVX93_19660 [Mycolicibacterium boenickei]
MVLVSVLVLCVWNSVQAKADTVACLKAPSPAMGRDIPVAFQAGGPDVVVVLDAFNAAPDVSRWVASADAMDTPAGKGFSGVDSESGCAHAVGASR